MAEQNKVRIAVQASLDNYKELIQQLKEDSEEILIAEIDRGRMEDVRRIWPFFRDRRIDEFEDLCKRSIK